MSNFLASTCKNIQTRTAVIALISLIVSLSAPSSVFAAAMVTPATGGSSIGNSTAGGAYTSLTGPVIAEGALGDIGVGTIVLTAPSGFEFNTGSTATLTITKGACASGNGVLLTGGAAVEGVTPTSSSITFTVTAASTGDADCASTATFSGVEVRPTAAAPLATGNLTVAGTSAMSGVTGSTNFGTLTEVDDTKPVITLTGANPQEIQIGVSYSELGATATDDVDGDISGTITIDASAVNTNAIASYSVTYDVSDAAGNAATQETRTVNVVKKDTTTALTSSLNPSVISNSVMFTATVTGFSPTGSVQFLSGATVLSTETLSAGVATFSTTTLAVGTNMITASYLGDSQNNASVSSPALQQVVNQSPTSTATLSAPDPSIVGQNASFTVTVTGVGPTGNVEFYSGATLLGTEAVSAVNATTSQAVHTTNALGVGTYTIHGVYLGDTNNKASTTNTVDMHVVDKETSTTTALTAPNSSVVGDTVTFSAEVEGFNPTGVVEFLSGAVVLGSGQLMNLTTASGTATFMTDELVPAGNYTITASYLGDGNNTASVSSPSILQVVDKKATTSTLVSSPNSSIVGNTVTFSAEVEGFNPTGIVEFLSGAVVLGSGQLMNLTTASGTATFMTDQLVPAGNYSITASYLGDLNNLTSMSTPALLQVVDKKQSVTVMTSTPNPATRDQTIVFSVTVTGFNPTGIVTLTSNGKAIDQGTIDANGEVVFKLKPTEEGIFDMVANYAGDLNNLSSSSDVIEQEIRGGTQSSRRKFLKLVRMLGGGTGVGFATLDTNVLEEAGGSGLTAEQMEALCKAHKSIYEIDARHVIDYMSEVYAHSFGVEEKIISDILNNRYACSDETVLHDSVEHTEQLDKQAERSAYLAAVRKRVMEKLRGKTVAFPVDELGIPVSSNEIWNACIRHYQIFQAGSHRPLNCRRFHKGHTWKHPDLNISFKWSDRYVQQLKMRHNFVVVRVPTPDYIVKREMKLTHLNQVMGAKSAF